MARIETALTRLLEIEHPIVTAPLTGAVDGALANAVTHAGAFGIVGPGPDEAPSAARSQPPVMH
jgi:nitronate monooxygenase